MIDALAQFMLGLTAGVAVGGWAMRVQIKARIKVGRHW